MCVLARENRRTGIKIGRCSQNGVQQGNVMLFLFHRRVPLWLFSGILTVHIGVENNPVHQLRQQRLYERTNPCVVLNLDFTSLNLPQQKSATVWFME